MAIRAVHDDAVNELGVGVAVRECAVVTADHVVRNADSVEVGPDATPAAVSHGDPRTDLAILAVPAPTATLPVTTTDEAGLGGTRAWVVAAGDAVPRPIHIDSVITLRQRRLPSADVVERRAIVLRGGGIGPGDSGAAVVNGAGELVGVVTLADRAGDVAYAVAPSEITAVLADAGHRDHEEQGCGDDDS